MARITSVMFTMLMIATITTPTTVTGLPSDFVRFRQSRLKLKS